MYNINRSIINHTLNLLWPSDATWRQLSGSTLVQIMTWRHQAITWNNVDWSSRKSGDSHIRAISQEMPQPSITKICLKTTCLKLHSNFPGVNELTCSPSQLHIFSLDHHSDTMSKHFVACPAAHAMLTSSNIVPSIWLHSTIIANGVSQTKLYNQRLQNFDSSYISSWVHDQQSGVKRKMDTQILIRLASGSNGDMSLYLLQFRSYSVLVIYSARTHSVWYWTISKLYSIEPLGYYPPHELKGLQNVKP